MLFVSTDCKADPENVAEVAGFTYQSCWVDNAADYPMPGPA